MHFLPRPGDGHGLPSDRADHLGSKSLLAGLEERPIHSAEPIHSAKNEERIGKFRLVREIGRGAMGVVYEAFQDDLQRCVALKVIAPGVLDARPNAQEAFETEARLAASVRHPGVVTVHEVGFADGRAYLAMEFVEGESLGAASVPMDPRELARVTLEIARAVSALHEGGIVHRDLKPDNVLMDRDGRARVTDFGLAFLHGESGVEVAGTPGFMAPEQLRAGFGPVGEGSDVYALGAVMHSLMTGQHPNAAKRVIDVVIATVERDLPVVLPAPGVPAELSAICRRCLERRVEARYASAAAVADDLESWLRGDAPEATPPGRLRQAQSFFRRRRMLAGRVLALFAFGMLSLLNYAILGVMEAGYFFRVIAVLGLLATASVLLDWMNRRGSLLRQTPYVWPLLDCVGLTWVLHVGDGLDSSLIVLYPLLIVMTGSWLDRSVVFVTMVLAMLAYASGIALGTSELAGIEQHLAVMTTLLVTALLMGMQVERTRALREYASSRW